MKYEITTFGEEILTYRQLAGKSQEDLANDLGVNRSTLSAWETNKVIPSPQNIRLLISKGAVTRSRARDLLLRAHEGYPIGGYEFTISLAPPRNLLNEGLKFGLLYVRKGDLSSDLWKQKPANLVFWFSHAEVRGQTMLISKVRQPDRAGFQFKCFVDFANMGWRQVAKELGAIGYIPDDHPSDGPPMRLYFLLPDEEIIEGPAPKYTKDNYYLPE